MTHPEMVIAKSAVGKAMKNIQTIGPWFASDVGEARGEKIIE